MAASYPSRTLCVLVLIGPLLAPANAKVVSYSFTALIDGLSTNRIGEEGPVPSFEVPSIGVVSVGDSIKGTLNYDTLSPLAYSFDGEFGYQNLTAAPTLTYRVGNIAREFLMTEPQSIIVTPAHGNIYFRTDDSPPGFIDYSTSLFFDGASPEVFSTSHIPEYLNINDFPIHRMNINWYVGVKFGYDVAIAADITSFTPVPEPAAPLLVGAGLGAFLLCRTAITRTALLTSSRIPK